jgi:hypothetical protein
MIVTSRHSKTMVLINILQGLLLGLEWDWEGRWITFNLLLLKVTVLFPLPKKVFDAIHKAR